MKILLDSTKGWMGDCLFVSSVAQYIKQSIPEAVVDLKTGLPFLVEALESVPSINKVYTNVTSNYDYVIEYGAHNSPVGDENVINTFTNIAFNVIGIPKIETLCVCEPLDITKIPIVDSKVNLPTNYITVQSDWQKRTVCDINYILKELTNVGVEYIVVNKDSNVRQGTEEVNQFIFNATCNIMKNSKLHLGMFGGSTVLATYCNIPTITDVNRSISNVIRLKNPDKFQDIENSWEFTPANWTGRFSTNLLAIGDPSWSPKKNSDNFLKTVKRYLNL
jgi:hypothetical protein